MVTREQDSSRTEGQAHIQHCRAALKPDELVGRVFIIREGRPWRPGRYTKCSSVDADTGFLEVRLFNRLRSLSQGVADEQRVVVLAWLPRDDLQLVASVDVIEMLSQGRDLAEACKLRRTH